MPSNVMYQVKPFEPSSFNITEGLIKGNQARALMNENAIAPQRKQELEQSNEVNRLAIEDYQGNALLRSRQKESEIQKLDAQAAMETAKAFYEPAIRLSMIHDKLASQYGNDEQAIAQAMEPYYAPIRDKARSAGIGATDQYDHTEMQSFIQSMKEATGKGQKVMGTPQLRDVNGKQEVWYFNEQGHPVSKVRDATASDMKEKTGPEDLALAKQTIKDMSESRKIAMKQNDNISTLNRAMDLVKTGNVTGKMGQLRALIGPYAESVGLNTQAMNDAQTFEALGKMIVGPLRLEILGPGPVTDWEQKRMDKMAGGGGQGMQAALELMDYYKKQARAKIDSYNESIDNAASLVPEIKKIHKPVKMGVVSPEQSTGGGTGRTQRMTFNPKTGRFE